MGRTVTAILTHLGTCLGSVGPFAVEDPWWANVRPVVEHLEETLGSPVVVLRLLSVEGSDGARDGHVTYLAEPAQRPAKELDPCDFVDVDHPLRLPWARMPGVTRLIGWAARHVELTGTPEQMRTWNLAVLFRLPTAAGPVWLKGVPPFGAAEPVALAAFAAVDPGLVPTVLATEPGRLLLTDVPGEDGWNSNPRAIVRRLATAQSRIEPPPGLPDRRPEVLHAAVAELIDRIELTPEETKRVRRLQPRWEQLAGCGLPDTVVHGDFHPGNWRGGAVLDFADAHLGNPVLDGLRAIDYLPQRWRRAAAEAWVGAWQAAVPRARPLDALRMAEPLAHLAYAVRYQEFLDNIEPDERVYHLGDPAAVIRDALAIP
jgi:hypothetical protein